MNTKDLAVESIISEKEIARDILLKMMEMGWINADDYPDAKNTIGYVCEAYRTILKTVREG